MLERMRELDVERTVPDAELARQARWWANQFPGPDGVRLDFLGMLRVDNAVIDGARWSVMSGRIFMQRRTINPLTIFVGMCITPSPGGWGLPFEVGTYMDGGRLYKWQRKKLLRFVRDAPQIKARLEELSNARVKRAAAKRLAKLSGEREEADTRSDENLEILSNSAIEAARTEPNPATRIAILRTVRVPAERREDALYVLGMAHLEMAGREHGNARLENAKVAAEALEQVLDRPDINERQQAIYGLFSAKLISGDSEGALQVLTANSIDVTLLSLEQSVVVSTFLESRQPQHARPQSALPAAPKTSAAPSTATGPHVIAG
jgi:hypothetical protein